MAVTNKLPQMTMMFPLAVAQEISTLGFTESVFGRRRHFPQWHPRDRGMLRQAVNFKMGQSPAFDIMKVAMVDMAARVKQQKLKGYLCGQIHDEIMVLCPLDEVDTFASNMREALTRPIREYSPDFPYEVPLDCEVEWGENYGELKKWLPSEAVAPQTIVLEDPRAKYIEVIRDLLPCQKCNFFEYTGWVKVPGEGSVKPPVKLLWLGAMPGPEDVTQMRPFAGRPGSRLRQEAYISGLPMPPEEGVLALNALWCWNEHSEGITNNHISNCRPYLDRILEICRPQLIVALGSVAMRSILRCREAGVENNLGWHTLPDGARVMVTYHPAFILRSPGFGPEWRKHLNEVKVALEAL